jgi:hypothetical protein
MRTIIPKMDNPPSFKRPKASSIGTPVYHRKRRDWKDDRDLLEELAAAVNRLDGPYEYYEIGVLAYREKIKVFREKGYEVNKEAYFLCMWIREQLGGLSRKQGSYDLRVHSLTLPEDLDQVISGVEKRATQSGFGEKNELSLSTLFPDPQLRNFARERMQILHRGNLHSYLSSLVAKEKDSLVSASASIMDLIHICEQKLAVRNVEVTKRFLVGETDLWVQSWSLGIEVRTTWNPDNELELLNTLSDTNFRLKARHLVVVVPDDLSDEAFDLIRQVEKREVIKNLSIIRIGDLGKYLDEIKKAEEANG